MKRAWSLLILVLLSPHALAQGLPVEGPGPSCPGAWPGEMTGTVDLTLCQEGPAASSDRLAGNHNFRNFINFMSNPLQSIDPRAVTAVYPLFGSAWVTTAPPLPDGNFQVYGPAMTIALSERFAVGMNQGGYAVAHFSRNAPDRVFQGPFGLLRERDFSGDRSGFLNLGGFAQYTLIQDVEDQFLLTAGLRWEAPAGSREIFQGRGPLHLAPYLTAGKELGDFHVLATTGYQFPAGPGNDTTKLFYANFHLDRRLFGWLYPLVELNCIYHSTSVALGLPTRRGFIDLGSFESTGNIVTLAAGANAVIVPERLEVGAVYTTSIATQRNFDVNGLLVKMVLRY